MYTLYDLLFTKAITGSSGGGGSPVLTSITLIEDGVYTPPSNVDGYNYIRCEAVSHIPDGDNTQY